MRLAFDFKTLEEKLPAFIVTADRFKEVGGTISEIVKKGFADDDVLVVFKVYDIARLVKRHPGEVFKELTRHFVVPALPLRAKKKTVWVVPACDQLRRFFVVSGMEDVAEYVYTVVRQMDLAYIDVSSLDEESLKVVLIASAIKVSASKLATLKRLLALNPPDSTTKEEIKRFIERSHDECHSRIWRRLGNLIFVPVSFLRNVYCMDIEPIVKVARRLRLSTILKKGQSALENLYDVLLIYSRIWQLSVDCKSQREPTQVLGLEIKRRTLDRVGRKFWTAKTAWHRFYSAASNEAKLAMERYMSDSSFDSQVAKAHFLVAVEAARKRNCIIYRRQFVANRKKRKFRYLKATEEPQKSLAESLQRAFKIIENAVASIIGSYLPEAEGSEVYNVPVNLGWVFKLQIPKTMLKSGKRLSEEVSDMTKFGRFMALRTSISTTIERFGLKGLLAIVNNSVDSLSASPSSAYNSLVSSLQGTSLIGFT